MPVKLMEGTLDRSWKLTAQSWRPCLSISARAIANRISISLIGCSFLYELLDVCVAHATRYRQRPVRCHDDQHFARRAPAQKVFGPTLRQWLKLFHSTKAPAPCLRHTQQLAGCDGARSTAPECSPYPPSPARSKTRASTRSFPLKGLQAF